MDIFIEDTLLVCSVGLCYHRYVCERTKTIITHVGKISLLCPVYGQVELDRIRQVGVFFYFQAGDGRIEVVIRWRAIDNQLQGAGHTKSVPPAGCLSGRALRARPE